MSARYRLSVLATAVAIALPYYASAADTKTPAAATPSTTATPEDRTDSVTVVGNWLDSGDNETAVLDHPGARTIIDQKQIREKGAETIGEALRGTPGVQVQENNGTGGSDISLNIGVRGLTSRLSPRSTIMMDGVPLAVAPYGQPQLSMAPLSMGNIQSIDVIRGGAGSALRAAERRRGD
ncbi:outer membrane receptor for Fe3+-dicitrate [Ewingella americana]